MLMILLGRYLSGPGGPPLSKQDPRPHTDLRGRGTPWGFRKPYAASRALETGEPGFAVLAASTSSSSWQPLQQSELEAAHQLNELGLIPVAMRAYALPVPTLVALISREPRDKRP